MLNEQFESALAELLGDGSNAGELYVCGCVHARHVFVPKLAHFIFCDIMPQFDMPFF